MQAYNAYLYRALLIFKIPAHQAS